MRANASDRDAASPAEGSTAGTSDDVLDRLRILLDPLDGGWWSTTSRLERPAGAAFETALVDAVDALFRPVDDGGFWDTENERFIQGYRGVERERSEGLTWLPRRGVEYRHGPLATMAALQWRTSPFGTDAYDDRLRGQLEHCQRLATTQNHRGELAPGVLGALVDAFTRASTVLDPAWIEVATVLFERTRGRTFDHAEDGLLLAGWAALSDVTDDRDVRAAVTEGVANFESRQQADGWPGSDDATRQFDYRSYAIWGLARAAASIDRPAALSVVETHLERTLVDQVRADGGVLSAPVPAGSRLGQILRGVTRKQPASWQVVRPRNQALLATTVAAYVAAGGSCRYDRAAEAALGWVLDRSRTRLSTLDDVVTDLPLAPMTIDRKVAPPGYRRVTVGDLGALIRAFVAGATDVEGERRRVLVREPRGSSTRNG
ncbi:hypothetical protein [Natronosalvus rutilus]|uniref:Uncharacterized protein n=1 Tax=Natronosalvus rutilus TaxID=2953753 RepID=A0A9E7NDH7_9EURY|nr:hypothetical protein [Natronosalvus rutilus]UTF54949.1 hypothetical protein NGM29_06755 [Natronosalvus rutilus]